MSIIANSVLTRVRNSRLAGKQAAEEVIAGFDEAPKVVLVYQTVNHAQDELLLGLGEVLPDGVPVLGCSGQGVVGAGEVREDGYAASVMALGGDSIEVHAACSRDIHLDTLAKGKELGRELRRGAEQPARVAIVHYDLLGGVDVGVFLDGLYSEIECPMTGGAAAHYFPTEMTTTYQYFGSELLSLGAVALTLGGDITAEMAMCTGCAPLGAKMVATRCEGNYILELDGRPALDVWQEITGAKGERDPLSTASLAIGVPVEGVEHDQLMRAAYVLDAQRRGIMVQAAIPAGTELTLHHRTVTDVLEGARGMARELVERLSGKKLLAALSFECGGRTKPFLGAEVTNQEHQELQAALGASAAWGGAVVWGEVFPVGGKPGFHNFTHPLLVLAD